MQLTLQFESYKFNCKRLQSKIIFFFKDLMDKEVVLRAYKLPKYFYVCKGFTKHFGPPLFGLKNYR